MKKNNFFSSRPSLNFTSIKDRIKLNNCDSISFSSSNKFQQFNDSSSKQISGTEIKSFKLNSEHSCTNNNNNLKFILERTDTSNENVYNKEQPRYKKMKGLFSSDKDMKSENEKKRFSTIGRHKGIIGSTALKNSSYMEQEYALSVIENYAREVGISAFNLRTMEFFITQFIDNEAYVNTITMINYWRPLEVVMNQKSENSCIHLLIKKIFKNSYIGFLPRKNFSEDVGRDIYMKSGNKEFTAEELSTKYVCMASLAGLLTYLDQNPSYMQAECLIIRYHYLDNHLNVSFQSTLDLELLFNTKFNKSYGSLFSLFHCNTISGYRLLRSNILQPVALPDELERRFQAVEELIDNSDAFKHIKEFIVLFKDLEVHISKFMHKLEDPSEGIIRQILTSVQGIRNCLKSLKVFKEIIKFKLKSNLFVTISKCLDDNIYEHLLERIDNLIEDFDSSSVKLTRKQDTIFFLIKEGISNVLDVSRKTYSDTINEIFAEFEKLKVSTNDPNIKLCFSEAKGYYITIEERYYNAADYVVAKKLGKKISCSNIPLVSLSERIKEIKRDLVDISIENINELLIVIRRNINYLYVLSSYIALLDMLCSFADYSNSGVKTVKPVVHYKTNEKHSFIFAKNCRHPLLEKYLIENGVNGNYIVPNDYFFSNQFNMLLLKGANASGKTTYMKQLGLTVILAQVGCYVPCDYFEFSLRKFLYTRFDSNDSIEENRGTFVKQIIEIQKVITNHSSESLVLLDEPFDISDSKENFAISISILDQLTSVFRNSFIIISSHNNTLSQLSSFYLNIMMGTMVVQFSEESMNFLFKFQFNNPCYSEQSNEEVNNNISNNLSNEENYGIILANMIGMNKGIIEKSKEIAIKTKKLEIDECIFKINSLSSFKLFLFKLIYYLHELRYISKCYVIEEEVFMKRKEILQFIHNSLN